jgi:hypothetical protein
MLSFTTETSRAISVAQYQAFFVFGLTDQFAGERRVVASVEM